jgi:hypothetical protein
LVLAGKGAVLDPHDVPRLLAPHWLSVVPVGSRHALECGEVQNETRIEAPPAGEPVCRLAAGAPELAELVVACGRSHFSEAFRKHHGIAPTDFRTSQA